MLAVSEGLPIKCFAVGVQRHPYAFSLGKNPIRKPQDMIGKRIGIHATGMVLLKAMLARHQIPESQVSIVPIGSDMMPLLSGRVDAVAGWQTNVSALKALGAERVDMSLWDSGVRLYACPITRTPTRCAIIRPAATLPARPPAAGTTPTAIATRRWNCWSRSFPA